VLRWLAYPGGKSSRKPEGTGFSGSRATWG
jgi:hypothetical protein